MLRVINNLKAVEITPFLKKKKIETRPDTKKEEIPHKELDRLAAELKERIERNKELRGRYAL
jgi:hypothetical protein